jgi:hypothetical protein
MVPVRWALLVVIAAAVVAACGGSDGADRATVSAPPKSADAATSRVVEPPPSGHPASFFTGPAGASNPLPPAGKAWFGTHTLCYPDPKVCGYQDHLNLTHSREAAIGRQFNVIADFQQSRCSLDMGRVHAFRAEGPLVLSWEPNPHKPDQVLAGQADSCIRAVAGQLATITTGNPVILRMYHEWNGTWMSWSTNSNGTRITATQARDVFRRTVDQLRAGGAFANGKVATMLDWHEGYFGNGDAFDEIAAYPGDAYVDWIGSTGYSYGTTDQWCGGTTQHYCELSEVLHHGQCLTPPFPQQQQPGFSCNASRVPVGTEVFARNRKPYLLSETGRAENAISLQGSWMRYAGAYITANMPGLYGVTYFDVNAQAFGEPHNWSLSTNTAKLQGFGDWGAMPRFTETAPNPNEPSPIAGLGYTGAGRVVRHAEPCAVG